MLIDSHVNLHAPQFDEDRDAVIARAREAGVGLMVEISDKLSTFDASHALALASGATLEADQLAQAWVAAPTLDRAEVMAVADKFRGAEGQERFEILMDRLIAAVKLRALDEGKSGARWAELWERLSELPDRAAALNLDRADVLAGALADLQRVKGRA